MTDPVPTDAPNLPPLPATDDLVARFRQLVDALGKVDQMRAELAAIDARLHERGINPATYTPGDGHSNTIDHAQPEATP